MSFLVLNIKTHVYLKPEGRQNPGQQFLSRLYFCQVDNSMQALVSATMPILRLLKTAAFGPEESKVLAAAFETAWNVLRRSGSTLAANDKAAMTRELLAKQIVEMGQMGERDHQRLVNNALVHVASCQMISRGLGRLHVSVNGRRSNY